jgi:hypothetical protein
MNELKIGVTNPFALGEILMQKRIKWDTLVDPEGTLSEILNIPVQEIFNVKNPILSPSFKYADTGELLTMTREEARTRLSVFLERNREISPTRNRRINSLVPKITLEKLPDLIYNSNIEVSGTNVPWLPANIDWFDMGDYFEDLNEFNDPIQGSLGDCYFIAALSSVVWSRPYTIINMIRPGTETNPIHKVIFYKDGTTEQSVEVNENVPVSKTTHNWIYARSLDLTEVWPAVMEKAYAKWRTENTTDYPEYPPLAGGDPVMACAQLIKGTRTYLINATSTLAQICSLIIANCIHLPNNKAFNPMVAWTYATPPSGINYTTAKVVPSHAYSVLGWISSGGVFYVVLRNPWGTYTAVLDVLSGSWPGHAIPLNSNGVFAMKLDTFKNYFAGIGVAK